MQEPLSLEAVRRRREAILRLASARRVGDVRVFGSVARAEAKPSSDLDLLVHPLPGCSLLDLIGFEHDVSDLLGGIRVDVLSDRAIKDRFAPYILSEAQPV